jgi:hypothetical protein
MAIALFGVPLQLPSSRSHRSFLSHGESDDNPPKQKTPVVLSGCSVLPPGGIIRAGGVFYPAKRPKMAKNGQIPTQQGACIIGGYYLGVLFGRGFTFIIICKSCLLLLTTGTTLSRKTTNNNAGNIRHYANFVH